MKFSQKRMELVQDQPLYLLFFTNTFKLLKWILFVPFWLSSTFNPEEDFLELAKNVVTKRRSYFHTNRNKLHLNTFLVPLHELIYISHSGQLSLVTSNNPSVVNTTCIYIHTCIYIYIYILHNIYSTESVIKMKKNISVTLALIRRTFP